MSQSSPNLYSNPVEVGQDTPGNIMPSPVGGENVGVVGADEEEALSPKSIPLPRPTPIGQVPGSRAEGGEEGKEVQEQAQEQQPAHSTPLSSSPLSPLSIPHASVPGAAPRTTAAGTVPIPAIHLPRNLSIDPTTQQSANTNAGDNLAADTNPITVPSAAMHPHPEDWEIGQEFDLMPPRIARSSEEGNDENESAKEHMNEERGGSNIDDAGEKSKSREGKAGGEHESVAGGSNHGRSGSNQRSELKPSAQGHVVEGETAERETRETEEDLWGEEDAEGDEEMEMQDDHDARVRAFFQSPEITLNASQDEPPYPPIVLLPGLEEEESPGSASGRTISESQNTAGTTNRAPAATSSVAASQEAEPSTPESEREWRELERMIEAAAATSGIGVEVESGSGEQREESESEEQGESTEQAEGEEQADKREDRMTPAKAEVTQSGGEGEQTGKDDNSSSRPIKRRKL